MLLTHSASHHRPLAKPGAPDFDSSNSNSDEADCDTVAAVAPTTLVERLQVVSRRFLHDVCSWTAFDNGRPLEADEIERAAT